VQLEFAIGETQQIQAGSFFGVTSEVPITSLLVSVPRECGTQALDDFSFGTVAPTADFRPGKGCGDKNHVHEREAECKKAPK
jgi:hypothetical protein